MEQKPCRTSKRRAIRKIEVHFDLASDDDDDDFQFDDKDNMQLVKESVKNMLDYSSNSTEYHPAVLVITPHYLKNVPNELVFLMMDYLAKQPSPHLRQMDLYQCALVNKQMYRIANPMLWHTPTITNANVLDQLTNSLVMDTTSLLGKHLQWLYIQGSYWNDIDFSYMLPFLRSLRALTIIDNAKNITCASLKHLPRSCPQLTHLYLVNTTMTSEFIDAIRQHSHHLIQLGVSTEGLPMDVFKKLAKCPLKIIILYCNSRNDPFRTEGTLYHLRSGNMIHDMKAFDQLNQLSIKGPVAQHLTHTIFSMTDTWPRLTRLYIAGQNNISDTVFTSFIKSHRQLKYLDLQIQLSDAALNAIATHLPHLTHLLLHDNRIISKRGVCHLVRHCNHLKQADFINCHPIVNTMPEFFDPKSNGVTLDAGKMQQIRQAAQQ